MRRTGESSDVEREEPIRVVLAEDHAEFRLGPKEMLATDRGIEVVGEAENGARAVAREVRPDVVVLDLVMPVMEGREALVHLQDRCWAMSCSAAYESAERTTRPLVNAHKASLSITQ
jgi:DNA-binding NarL/FixJ family response regulator